MYRHASLRLPCVGCQREEPLERMAMSPHGGLWCWGCRMAAQIVELKPPPSVLRQILPALAIGLLTPLVLLILGGFGLLLLIGAGRC
jgi:hypothetical protein